MVYNISLLPKSIFTQRKDIFPYIFKAKSLLLEAMYVNLI